MIKKLAIFFFTFMLFLMATPITIMGQASSDSFCQDFVNYAFSQTGTNCANLDDENACYAYGSVPATFFQDSIPNFQLEDVFAKASDRVSFFNAEGLLTLEQISPDAFRRSATTDDTEWGMAVLRVRANLPQQLEQNTAVYVVFGGARIENGVFPDDALLLSEPVSITVSDAMLFSSPPGLGYMVQSEPIAIVSDTLEADGQSADGAWVRVFYRYQREYGERATAWLNAGDVEDAGALTDLPIITADTRTHMQSIYLTNSLIPPSCENVPPPSLLIQGPDNIETDVFVNDVPVRITSTAFIQQISADRMRIAAIDGIVILFPESDDEIVLLPGFGKVICLSEFLDLGIDSQENDFGFIIPCSEGPPSVFIPVSSLDRLPSNILNYIFQSPTQACASTVGSVICTIQISFQSQTRIRELCESGQVSELVCERFGF